MLRLALRPITSLIAGAFRLMRFLMKGTSILLIVAMLSLNVASLTIGSLNAFLSSLIDMVGVWDTVHARTTSDIDRARARATLAEADLKKSRAEADSLQKRLKTASADLDFQRAKTRQLDAKVGPLEAENRKLRADGPDVRFRGQTRSMRSVVEETTGIVKLRTAKVATANVGSMAGEGIPFWGIAVIVVATGYEVTTACDTMKDMHDLSVALAPGSADDTEVQLVCGMRVPSKEELWTKIKASPGAAWDSAAEFVTGLPRPEFSEVWAYLNQQLSWD